MFQQFPETFFWHYSWILGWIWSVRIMCNYLPSLVPFFFHLLIFFLFTAMFIFLKMWLSLNLWDYCLFSEVFFRAFFFLSFPSLLSFPLLSFPLLSSHFLSSPLLSFPLLSSHLLSYWCKTVFRGFEITSKWNRIDGKSSSATWTDCTNYYVWRRWERGGPMNQYMYQRNIRYIYIHVCIYITQMLGEKESQLDRWKNPGSVFQKNSFRSKPKWLYRAETLQNGL